MGKRVIISEEERNEILKKYQINEGTLSTATAEDGKLVVNNKFKYRLETDNFMGIDIDIQSFDLDSGEYILGTPLGTKEGTINNRELMNYLSSNLSDGKEKVSFEVNLDNKEQNLRFVKD